MSALRWIRRVVIIVFTVAFLPSCSNSFSGCPDGIIVSEQKLSRGIRYRHLSKSEPVRSIHIAEIDLSDPLLRLESTPGDGSADSEYRAQTTSRYLEQSKLQLAVNGGFLEPFFEGTRGGDDYFPHAGDGVNVIGSAIAAGKIVSPPEMGKDARVDSIICIRGPEVWIESGQDCLRQVDYAVSAGPLLLRAGRARSLSDADRPDPSSRAEWYTKHGPRTAFGVNSEARRAWFVVIDGRQPEISAGATYQELCELFLELGASDAINLDGGGSSTMVVRDSRGVRVLNSPIHTYVRERERPVANHLGVRVSGSGE